jgi:hypothetical protein
VLLAAPIILAVGIVGLALVPKHRAAVAPVGPTQQIAAAPKARLPFQPGEELDYEFGWSDVPAARLHVVLKEAEQSGRRVLTLEYSVQSASAIEVIWNYRVSGKTSMDAATLLPTFAERTSQKDDRDEGNSVRFNRAQGTAVVSKWKQSPEKAKHKLVACEDAVDPASAFLLVRTAPLAAGRTGVIRVLSGEDLYEITATPGERGRVESPAGSFDAVRIDLTLRKLPSPGAEEPASESALRTARVWLAEDSRIPVRLESDVAMGKLYAELVRFVEPEKPR